MIGKGKILCDVTDCAHWRKGNVCAFMTSNTAKDGVNKDGESCIGYHYDVKDAARAPINWENIIAAYETVATGEAAKTTTPCADYNAYTATVYSMGENNPTIRIDIKRNKK